MKINTFVFLCFFPLVTYAENTKFYSQEQFGAKWPFTVNEGYLACEPHNAVIFITNDGKKYGVNGIAQSTRKYLKLEEIWKPNLEPGLESSKMSLPDNFIQDGLSLCE
ncbi:DUF2511 domain-containing protein [Legionella sp. WA2024007413]